MNKFFNLILVLMLLSACNNEVELSQPEYTSKVVVDGCIESGDFARVYLTRSSPFLTNYDSISILKTFINNATIKIACSNGDSEVMTLYRESSFFPPFVYKTVRLKGIPGETYSLEIKTGGRIITAKTTIPQVVDTPDIKPVVLSDSSCRFSIAVQPSLAQNTYLYLQYKSKLADQNYHPAGIPVYKIEPASSKTTAFLYRCDESNIALLSGKKYYKGWPKNDFSIRDELKVKVGVVDAESYQILKSLFADESIRNNPFAFNSAGIQSNIKGGIGRWTGIGVQAVQVAKVNPLFWWDNSTRVLF